MLPPKLLQMSQTSLKCKMAESFQSCFWLNGPCRSGPLSSLRSHWHLPTANLSFFFFFPFLFFFSLSSSLDLLLNLISAIWTKRPCQEKQNCFSNRLVSGIWILIFYFCSGYGLKRNHSRYYLTKILFPEFKQVAIFRVWGCIFSWWVRGMGAETVPSAWDPLETSAFAGPT